MGRNIKKISKIVKCFCGGHNVHTGECKRKNRYLGYNLPRRLRLRQEHRCLWCRKKVEPVLVYHQLCKKHRIISREKAKLNTNKFVKPIKVKFDSLVNGELDTRFVSKKRGLKYENN